MNKTLFTIKIKGEPTETKMIANLSEFEFRNKLKDFQFNNRFFSQKYGNDHFARYLTEQGIEAHIVKIDKIDIVIE